MQLPNGVDTMVSTYLAAVDAAAPGLVAGLYLVGSVALGDFRPQRSDIDFVALTARRADGSDLEALGRIHRLPAARRRRPFFDGIYVTRSELAGDPALLERCPTAHEGRLQPAGPGDLIAWHTLARHGVCCRGPAVDQLRIWTDARALAAWCDHNLDVYWRRRMLEPAARLFSRGGMLGLTAWFCEWCISGVSRLHYTLATGAITSKHGAARYALHTFPARWSRVIREALRIRRDERGALYRSKLQRRHDVLAFMRMAIADAHRIYHDAA